MQPLSTDKRAQILSCLVEGCSMRSTARLTGAAKVTIERLMIAAGKACAKWHDENVHGLHAKNIQLDEIWAFCGMKEANVPKLFKGTGVGDIWLWTALDSDTKLIIAWHVGGHKSRDAAEFTCNLASRVEGRPQVSSDGLSSYLTAIPKAFGRNCDYGQEIKTFANAVKVGYSPPKFIGSWRESISGRPNINRISTAHIERSNLTWRMTNRRFTRLSNAFSKKAQNHAHMVALSMMHYNFVRIHQTLRTSPAMAAGLTSKLWDMKDIVSLIDGVCA